MVSFPIRSSALHHHKQYINRKSARMQNIIHDVR